MSLRTLSLTGVSLLFLGAWSVVSPAAEPAAVVRWAGTRAPRIDARADDWGAVRAAESTASGPLGRASFKLAFDRDNFYALIFVSDSSPLKNRGGPLQELFKGGDAISLCFGRVGESGIEQRLLIARVDGRPVVWAMRPKWVNRKNAYQYQTEAGGVVAMDFVGPLEKAQAALAENADRKGYVAEVALPWSELGLKPVDGLQFPFDLQVIFSDAAGSANAGTVWWHSTGTGPMATMDVAVEARLYPDAWGTARLTPSGNTPAARERVEPVETVMTGPGTPIGFDLPRDATVSALIVREDGWVIDELLRARELKQGRHTLYWNGRDRTGQPMPAGAYRYVIGFWNGLKTTFYGSVGNSGRPVYRTDDGLGSIGGAHGGPAAVGADAGGIYMLHSGEEGQKCLRKIDPATGKAKWFASTGVFAGGYAVTGDGSYCYAIFGRRKTGLLLGRFHAQTGQPAYLPGQNTPLKIMDLTDSGPEGLAVANGVAYYSHRAGNRIGTVDLKTGTVGKDIAIAAPRGLCRLNNGELLVCSSNRILRLNPADGSIATVVASSLQSPQSVAVDKAGNLYVSDLGGSQQIKKFSPEGRLLAALGKEGGRAAEVARYDPLEFSNVTGLAIGPDEHLWLVERADAPRRFAKLTTDGDWMEDFYGPVGYSTCGVDLDDPSTVYYKTYGAAYVEAKVDYAAYARDPGNPVGAWRVAAIHNFTQSPPAGQAKPDLFADNMAQGYGRIMAFTATNGKRYLAKPGPDLSLFIEHAGRWKPVAFVRRGKGKDGDVTAWADDNGDGLVQDGETVRDGIRGSKWCGIGRDLTLHGLDGDLSPALINEQGAPVYTGGVFRSTWKTGRPPADMAEFVNYWTYATAPTPEGVRYLVVNVGPEQGRGFWDRATETRLAKVVDGRARWVIGHHDGTLRHNGDNQMLMNLAGELDGVLLASEVAGTFTAYTSDGLTLGWLARDGRGDFTSSGPTAWYVENVQPGLFFKDPASGRRLLIGASTEDIRILQLEGVFGDDITRLRGTVTLESALPRSPETAGRTVIPYRTWTLYKSRFLGVVGYDWIWAKDIPALTIREDRRLVADVRLRRDAGALCVFADVLDDTPFGGVTNGVLGQSDGVELLIGPDAPTNRAGMAAGDTRFFLTAVPAGSADSATGEKDGLKGAVWAGPPALDGAKLTPVKGATIVVRRRSDGLGYRLDAELPLTALPGLSAPATVTFNRAQKPNVTERRLDLAGPVRLNAAVWFAQESGRARRVSWVADDAAGANPAAGSPSRWGVAALEGEADR